MASEHRDISPHITTSPEGKPCIGMNVEGQDWILLTVKRAPLADRLVREFEINFRLPVKLGQPFDWRASLERNELVGGEDASVGVKGVYIPAEEFDRFIDTRLLVDI